MSRPVLSSLLRDSPPMSCFAAAGSISLPVAPLRSATLFWVISVLAVATLSCRPPQAVLEAQQLLERGQLAEAQRKVDEGLATRPESAELRRLSISICVARGDRRAALESYRRWIRLRGEDHEMLHHFALAVMRWGLRHRDPDVRLAALQSARQTDAAPLESVVAERLADPDEVVRTWASVALSGTPRGADVLEEQLHSSNHRARVIAVSNVARMAGKAALGALARFATDPAPSVREALADGLADIKAPDAFSLLARLSHDQDNGVRAAAITGLGRQHNQQGYEIVERALQDHYLGVRLAAVLALADLGHNDAARTLRSVAVGPDLLAALRAGGRLAKLGKVQPGLNAIAKGLVDRNPAVRIAACNAASSFPHRVAATLVERGLRDPEPAVRAAAIAALVAHGRTKEVLDAARRLRGLVCGHGAQTEPVCLHVGDLLAHLNPTEGRPLLAQLARNSHSRSCRIDAMKSALMAGAPLDLAAELLGDTDPQIDVAAATLLYERTE